MQGGRRGEDEDLEFTRERPGSGEEDQLLPGAAAAQSGPLQLGKQNRTEEEVEASVSVLDQQQLRLDPKVTQSEPHWPKLSLRWFEPSGPQDPVMVT